MKKIFLLCLSAALVFAAGCKSEKHATAPTGDPQSLTGEGWEFFEVGEYTNALAKFRDATAADAGYSEAWTGIGWTQLRLLQTAEALAAFQEALRISWNSNDAQAGIAFAYRATVEYVTADSAAATLLARSSIWVFIHDETVNRQDLIVLQAACRYLTGNYAAALAALQLVEPDFNVDVSTADGRVRLGARIEEWTLR